MTTKNEPIGEVECPVKGCTRTCNVFRFRPRPTERMQRFANKLYCRCPVHGRFGGDAGDDDMQAYIEGNARKCPSDDAGNAGKKEPATPDTKTAAAPQKMPAVPATPAPAKVPAEPAKEPAQPAPKKSTWFTLD